MRNIVCVVVQLSLKVGKYVISAKGDELNMRTAKIINNRAYTDGDTKLYTDLPLEIQEALIKWITHNIRGRKTANFNHSSYSLKEFAERSVHYYISNNQFKDAMLHCGFKPVNPTALNWCYRISEKSLVFKEVM
jgi:hypothetical protein